MTIQTQPSMAVSGLQHVPKWDKLSAADHVEVYRQGRVLAAGRVDVFTRAGDIVWLFLDHGHGRVLFDKADGVDIFKHIR